MDPNPLWMNTGNINRPERPTEPPATPPPSGGIDPAKARWDELLQQLRAINEKLDKIIDAEHQGLETVGVTPRLYVDADTRSLGEVLEDAERDNLLRTGSWSTATVKEEEL